MTQFVTRFERSGMTDSAYGCSTLSAPLAHLRYMSASHDKPMDRTPMWTLEELCTVLRTTPATIYTWRKHGQGPRAYKVGRHLLFADADVRAWLESRVADTECGDDEATPERRITGPGW